MLPLWALNNWRCKDLSMSRDQKVTQYGLKSHIHYACIIWGQNVSTIDRLFILQKKALRLIHFKERNAHSAPLFFKSKIVKLPDKIKIENCLFISNYVNNKLPPIFNSWFIFSSTCHNYETSFAAKGHLKIPTVTTTTYGKRAFIGMATKAWDNTQSQIKDPMINTFSPNKLKIFLFDFYLNLYQTQDFIASSGI